MEASDLYQEVILDHTKSPRNFHTIEDADRHAEGDNPLCGDELAVYLKLDGDRIEEIGFQASGCAISKASGSVMTDTVKGKTIEEVREIVDTFRTLVKGEGEADADPVELGDLAVFEGVKRFPTRVKCATLAWHTLLAALEGDAKVVTTEE